MQKLHTLLQNFFKKNPTLVFLLSWALLVVIVAVIFYLRYPYTYTEANFYAEDGTILFKNVLTEGPLVGPLSLFNGYLVIGQYILVNIAMFINFMFGDGIATMPKSLAVVSYLFWGIIVSLPYLLFRKKLGVLLSLITVLFLATVPFGGYDYAIIGTIGNLKFAFFYVASLLVLYRNQGTIVTKRYQFILIDIILLLCVLTNVLTTVLLPFCLWRYRKVIKEMFLDFSKKIRRLPFGLYSLLILGFISLLYVLFVYTRGIPEMPGYLDEPLIPSALLDILYRGSVYAITFPINSYMNDFLALFLLILTAILALLSKDRVILIFLGFAIVINVIGFTLSRPGITHIFQTYTIDGGHGLFFYAGTMLFVFAISYAIRGWFNRQSNLSKGVMAAIVTALVLAIIPISGLRETSYSAITGKRPSVQDEVNRVCAIKPNPQFVEIGIYPAENWTLTLPRDQVCN